MAKKSSTAEGVRKDPEFYKGRPIRHYVINLGIGGKIERNATDPDLPGEARVRFECEADVGADKFKYLEDGGVDSSTILTIDASTFKILDVTEKEMPPELPLDGTPPEDPKADHIRALQNPEENPVE